MAEIIGVTAWVIAAANWGDWRNWRVYHSTILYFILFDALYYYVSYKHRLWSLEPTWPLKTEPVALAGEFLVFIATILIFLGRFPKKPRKIVAWTALWIVLYTAIEWGLDKTGTFVNWNGWTLFQSFLFNIAMFILLRLHFKRPLLAYCISIPLAVIFQEKHNIEIFR